MKSRHIFTVFVVAIVLLGVSTSIIWIRNINHRIANYRRIETLIAQLATHPPDDLTPAQWSGCVFWTWQLHTNYGADYYFDHEESCKFADRLQRRLDGDVSLQTIDWIWDQYVRQTKGGKRYSDLYRPTTPERLRNAEHWDYRSLQEWAAEYDRLRNRS